MAPEEKTTFGASIVDPSLTRPTPPHLPTSFSQVSAVSDFSSLHNPDTPTRPEHDPANPFSSAPNSSLRPSTDRDYLDAYATDVEGGAPVSATTTIAHKSSGDGRLKECSKMSMWPSKQDLVAENKAARRKRRCGGRDPLRNCTRKQKTIIKITTALLIVGLATGLGVGISAAVGGGVWAGENNSHSIPNPHH